MSLWARNIQPMPIRYESLGVCGSIFWDAPPYLEPNLTWTFMGSVSHSAVGELGKFPAIVASFWKMSSPGPNSACSGTDEPRTPECPYD
ncbi:hypothetical protein Cob_v011597 [Colletotrichum orbiculare MAFF 240422]|uniref:Uncharacterized protein n=1 Tax=Colletotrichum orbiculare (strain 104-T / ATCC 96160 / CBS 514.97 / LARS 414 / MAFF 240422) TaxID=1213857 RepID=A0A484FBN4_COLOR|nr:hypothetical protein Cob_v011597 [Colletotrichum orbiculare MAFF 240422]